MLTLHVNYLTAFEYECIFIFFHKGKTAFYILNSEIFHIDVIIRLIQCSIAGYSFPINKLYVCDTK